MYLYLKKNHDYAMVNGLASVTIRVLIQFPNINKISLPKSPGSCSHAKRSTLSENIRV